jgi:hypothetical protein
MARPNNDIRSALSLPPADSVVDEMLRDSERKQSEASLSQEERRLLIEHRKRKQSRKEAERNKSKEQAANRLVLLLPKELKEHIARLAEAQRVTQSQVVTFFLYEALLAYRDGRIRFEEYLLPTDSPRYDWNLIHPLDSERFSRFSEKRQKRAR